MKRQVAPVLIAKFPIVLNVAPGADCLTLLTLISPIQASILSSVSQAGVTDTKRVKSRLHLAAGLTPENCKIPYSVFTQFCFSFRMHKKSQQRSQTY